MPDLMGTEEKYVVEALRSSWVSATGKYVDRFEEEFAKICGTRAAISVCNGTAALHLAMLALGVKPGDEVIVPSLTYIATANAVRYVGAEPVFADVDPATWCIDPARAGACITSRTKGIIAVHLYGHPADMDALNSLAGIHGLWVVEDAAEAHMAEYRGRKVGGLATMATFSFYGNKIFTSGEGGAITLNSPELEIWSRRLRGQGVDPARRYFFPVTGYNFRLTNLACAILCAQLERRESILERRREICAAYREGLAEVKGIGFQPAAPWAVVAPWLFCITVTEDKYGMNRDDLIRELDAQGIETRPFFIPLHTLPPFVEQSRKRHENLPHTDRLGATGINLPTYNRLADEEIESVIEVIRKAGRG